MSIWKLLLLHIVSVSPYQVFTARFLTSSVLFRTLCEELLKSVCSGTIMPNSKEAKSFLSDLGRATLRGVRRCPKCGTYNGTRGLSCKNKACDVVFKEAGEKRKLSTDACRLLTGTSAQVFSVRMRESGPDYRGFVQLLTEPVNPLSTSVDHIDGVLTTETSALCFVDSCHRSFDASILKCHEKSLVEERSQPVTCQHIQASLRCYTESQPLVIHDSVYGMLSLSDEVKQALWTLETESTGPIVQRVSKTIMAVKCKASPKHPLGYLHFAFFTSKSKDRTDYRYFCSCPEFKIQSKDEPGNSKRCVHFFACICAFASDPKLTEEFSLYVDMCKLPSTPSKEERQLLSILSEALEGGDAPCEVEVVLQEDDDALLTSASIRVAEDGTITQVTGLDGIQIHTLDPDVITYSPVDITDVLQKAAEPIQIQTSPPVKRKREDLPIPAKGPPNRSGGSGAVKKSAQGKRPFSAALKKAETPDESEANLSFIQWLASVTERINQTMHFQFDGKPDPLVFHVPQVFFDCLRERISNVCCNNKKKRLPNLTTVFVRNDSTPVGTFTKYTYHINSVIHVKHIFDTPLMPLDIIRSFVENRDGTYEPFVHIKDECTDSFLKTDKRPLRPLEVRTFLKVGNTAHDQSDPTPFILEWIPDVLPTTHTGELHIRFQYGHSRAGPSTPRDIFALTRPGKSRSKNRVQPRNSLVLRPEDVLLM